MCEIKLGQWTRREIDGSIFLPIWGCAAADRVIIPSQPSFLSTKGLNQLMHSVAKVKRQINPRLNIDGILLTMVDKRKCWQSQRFTDMSEFQRKNRMRTGWWLHWGNWLCRREDIRHSILDEAVRQYGKRRVADHIDFLMATRKGQNDGEMKFARALEIWQSDLNYIVRHYWFTGDICFPDLWVEWHPHYHTFLSLHIELSLFYKEYDVAGKLFRCHCGQLLG